MVNTLLNPSKLPYGLIPFDEVKPHDYEEAILTTIEQGRSELADIVNNPEAPTVANTLEPLEKLMWQSHRIIGPFFQLLWAESLPEIEEINLRIAPKLAAAQDEIMMNHALYQRLTELQAAPNNSAETLFLIENYLKQMRRAGVTLDDDAATRLRHINTELTQLQAEFGNRLLAGTKAAAVLVTDKQKLAGLDDDALAAYASAAAAQGLEGWLIAIENTTGQQILSRLEDAELRAEIMAASQARGVSGGEFDTRELIIKIARLRAEHAQLLGYANHAAYVADNGVIKTAEAVAELLGQLAEPAMANTRAEADQLAVLTPNGQTVTAADWEHYAEKLMRDKFNFDFEQLRPYLELQSVLHNGVFKAAHELYGLNFVERPDLHGYHPDVVVYEVFDDDKPQTPNEGRGLLLFDFYARPTKRGGAWMNPIISQNKLQGEKPVVTQTINLVKPAEGEATLITWDNVTTLFHEFGHALHGLLSDAYYPSQSGVNVPTDFVEYPSQVNEMWAHDPQMLANYARHYQTGEPIPAEWHTHLTDTKEFGAGFDLTEILAANAIDQAWHHLTPEQVPTVEEFLDFEKQALIDAGVYFPSVPPRYRTAYYNHIWAGGYSAGYYSYMLSKMFDADTVQWFKENGGLKRENGRKFAAEVLSKGFTRDAKESFRALRGRDAIIEPLLTRLGLSERP